MEVPHETTLDDWCDRACNGLAIFTPRAYAIFGFGDIVFDPSNYAEAVQQLLQMQRQYAQMVQTYLMVRNQYEHMRSMARQVPSTWRHATARS